MLLAHTSNGRSPSSPALTFATLTHLTSHRSGREPKQIAEPKQELLTAEEAMNIMEKKMSERFRTVREAFIRIDSDGDGFVGPEELRVQLELMGMRLSGREFRRLWRMFDTSGDDQVRYAAVWPVPCRAVPCVRACAMLLEATGERGVSAAPPTRLVTYNITLGGRAVVFVTVIVGVVGCVSVVIVVVVVSVKPLTHLSPFPPFLPPPPRPHLPADLVRRVQQQGRRLHPAGQPRPAVQPPAHAAHEGLADEERERADPQARHGH